MTVVENLSGRRHHDLLEPVVQAARRSPAVAEWLSAVRADPPAAAARAGETILPILLAALATELGSTLVVVAPDDTRAERLAEACAWYLGEERVASYLSRGVPYGSGLPAPPARVGTRARARRVAAADGPGVVVATGTALIEKLPRRDLRPDNLTLTVGGEIDRDELIARLVGAGYTRTEQAAERGEIAARGDIVDVFGTTAAHPARIELFGDEVDQIRMFSTFTQRSLGEVESLTIDPADEVAADAAGGGDAEWWADDAAPDGADGDDLLARIAGRWESGTAAFDNLPVVVWDGVMVQRTVDDMLADLRAGHAALQGYDDAGIAKLVADAVPVDAMSAGQPHIFESQAPAFAARGFSEAEGELRGLMERGMRIVVAFPHAGHAERTREQLRKVTAGTLADAASRRSLGLPDESGVWFATSLAASGFVSRQLGLAVVPSGRLFRQRAATDRTAGRVGQAMSAFTDLRAGDYVVHEDHGIGRFVRFETKTVAGITRDYLFIEFQGSDRLYVPHEQMHKVTRYVGADGSAPSLSKLGGKSWANLKNRARRAVRELAGELLALYAKRAQAVGHPFPPDSEIDDQVERSFPYEETEDQLRAISAVKEDMERPHPMDRLLCGDVGFGKTEVALRAAVKAAASGRQAMMLVPTTVLAQQHFSSFRERLDDLPLEVDMVSRFRSTKQIKGTLDRFRDGKVDVLVGTHRMLSRDVLPRDLGLVVVDEEQRFGVAQKEVLRQLRLEVDVLALSATPIPRTLHMSLAGLRDISVIETPPRGRRPIHTHVGEYDEELVRVAIERELDRDGQVMYLHNRVESIDEAAAKVQQIVPRARVCVGHGQLTEKQLEGVMLSFVRGDFDVLVATTIIESGLDIPTANTLIVERADVLGLAQLYQIRGRVGRSSRSAHAYLFYPSARELSEEARARLTTLSDYTELGSGFHIAMRDLEIRGAGNLLGAEQSGHVAAIGFELYVDLLAEAVSELSGEPVEGARVPNIDMKVDAYVPADYVASEAIKVDLHRRIALARSGSQLDELVEELRDRFGEVPDAVLNLVALSRIRLLMNELRADRLSVRGDMVSLAPLDLDRDQAQDLRKLEPLAVYSSTQREIRVRNADRDKPLERAMLLLRNVAASV